MKIKKIILTFVMSLLIMIAPIFASAGSLPKGKPFQMLSERIELNDQAIQELNNITSEIQSDLTALQADIATNSARISENESVISGLLLQIADLGTDIDANRIQLNLLNNELTALTATHEADLADLRAKVDLAVAEALQGRNELYLLISQVRDEIPTSTEIQQLVNENAQVLSLVTKIIDLENQINALNSLVTTLESNHAGRLAIVENILSELDNRVDVLESYHTTGLIPGNTDLVVAAEGIDGTGVIEFRCAAWDGDICTNPQGRVPVETASGYVENEVWHSMPYFNDPHNRICPSFCQGASANGDVVSCASNGTPVAVTPGGNVATGYSAGNTGYLSPNDYRWRIDYPSQNGFFNIRFGSYGVGTSQLQVQCNW